MRKEFNLRPGCLVKYLLRSLKGQVKGPHNRVEIENVIAVKTIIEMLPDDGKSIVFFTT